MLTTYLIGFTILGGLLALFIIAGWSSYNEGKLPEKPTLFRWFIAGILSAGLASYAWLFGAGGDPSKLMENVGSALEVNKIMDNLSSPAGAIVINSTEPVETKEKEIQNELVIGMPKF